MKYLLYYEGRGRIINILDSTTKKEVDNICIDFGEKVGDKGRGLPYSLEEFYKKELEGIYYQIIDTPLKVNGYDYRLFVFPEHTKEQIESANKYIFQFPTSVLFFEIIEVKEWI